MKKITLLLSFTFLVVVLLSQNYVSTEPQNKNAILEEFTGVSCPNCPAGHQVMATILAANPNTAFCVAYHPANSSYTSPYAGDPDFRSTYPNAFYSTPYCGSSRFMPSSFINRRVWTNGDRLQSRSEWPGYANTIMGEASPANMGMSTTYDIMSQTLYITVEIYYTDDMTDDNHIYVMLSENDLVSQQSGASGPYTHKHTFRESFVEQWGDLITEPTTQASLVTLEYSLSTTGSGYTMSNCEVLAFIENQTTGEIITGVGVHVGESTYIEPSAGFSVDNNNVGLGSQAIFTDESTGGPTSWYWTFEGGDPATSNLQAPPPITYNTAGQYGVSLTVTNPAGSDTITMAAFIIVGDVGIHEQYARKSLILYP
ncbi:MAG: Omp28-related outer membrane protein, partial [Bacteroidota bacterium]